MELLSDLVTVGPDGVSTFRRRMGVYFNLLTAMPWQDEDAGALERYIAGSVADGHGFDIILDHRFCLFKTAGLPSGPQALDVSQVDGVLHVTGRDIMRQSGFSLSIGVTTVVEALQRFEAITHRVKRLILRMPSKDFRTFIYIDWAALVADPSRLERAVRSDTCIFVPRLMRDSDTKGHQMPAADLVTISDQALVTISDQAALEPSFPSDVGAKITESTPLHPVEGTATSQDIEPANPLELGLMLPGVGAARRTLTVIMPLSDDLRTSFLAFGYSIGAGIGQGPALEIGAFRRNLRSSYSRLMAGTQVIDLKAQPPVTDVVLDLTLTLRQTLDNKGSVTCLLGSEVLSAEVLEIFRNFADAFDLAIHAVVCSASAPPPKVLEMIHDSLSRPFLLVQTICFVAAGEPSGFNDAAGRPRGYFGVPPVEGQSMARCMEFRSHAEDPTFTIPASVPSREAHALDRFINAFAPLRDDQLQKPAA